MREIDWRLRAIADRKNLERSFQGSLHGREMTTPRFDTNSNNEVKVKVTEKQLSAIEKAQEEAEKRIKARNGR